MDFSYSNRPKFIDKLKKEYFDLIVIGGGITGAGMALDAASRGLQVALVEKHDFTYGTSSRSTKLIHGGLRYLKQLEFGLVKEVGSERAIVHKLAPHLVIPEKMLLPLYEKRGLGSTLTSWGLKLYDWLAGVKPADRRLMLTRLGTLKQEPLLKHSGIKGGALYAEYRTDDARLTIEIIKSAVRHGVIAVSYCQVTGFISDNHSKLTGVKVVDTIHHEKFNIAARCIVNAAGPWVDDLREMDGSKRGKQLHLTKGVHIVVPFEKLPVRQAIYFGVSHDDRMIFAIPREQVTYIGTTDTSYSGDKDNVFATLEDATYLLNAVNNTFEIKALTNSDIKSSWAGLRPLIHEEGRSASELSRKDEIFESATGLISIAGGKLTGYRKMAERVVDLVVEQHFGKRNLKDCCTDQIRLTKDYFANTAAVQQFSEEIERILNEHNYDIEMARYLVSTYGHDALHILIKAISLKKDGQSNTMLKSEFLHGHAHEMICRVEDFFVRRTGMLYFRSDNVESACEALRHEFENCFNRNNELVSEEIALLLAMLNRSKTLN
jgi:glycerol-3-phosphate dehydrogenase